jgi:iron complex outermembrane receptor protein
MDIPVKLLPVSLIASLGASVSVVALAQTAGDTPVQREEITVIGNTPLPGSTIDPDKVPSNTQVLSAADVSREGQASLLHALNSNLGSVNINDDLNDPFQPDIIYRGFTASPVLGTSEGLAIYQNGVRINEAFGDTVNWDLFPDIAVNRITLVGSNPVFGLNALGGALNVDMKTGFTYQGGEAEISGGSFGQRNFSLQYGQQFGDKFAAYIATRVLNQDGWRQFSADSVQQLYADLAARGDDYALDVSFTGANNLLQGQGPSPFQELEVNRSLAFTSPQNFRDQVEFVTINGSYSPIDDLSLQSNFFYREFRQTVANGNTTDDETCADGIGLCDGDDNPVIGRNGKQVPDISQGGTIPIGENDEDATRTVSLGGSVQAAYTAPLFGGDNNFVVGASIDSSATDYQAFTQLGVVTPQLVIASSGIFVDEPDSTSGPVNLKSTNTAYGIYASDTFNVTPELAVTASGRFNLDQVRLMDQVGTALNGDAQYKRFNPAVGATYKIRPNVTAYAGYSEANRAPTAGELACSNPLQPCILPAFLSSDPPNLKQVVAHTYEIGLRGNFALPDMAPGRFTWKTGLYRTDLDNDIIAITSPLSLNQGFFQNAGKTRRQGAEASFTYDDASWSVYLNYSFIQATYQSHLQISAGSPGSDANGNVQVRPGDELPGVPEHRLKVGADYHVTPAWTVGGTLNFVSGQYFADDQANLNPQLAGHVVVNLHSTYEIMANLEIFGELDNAFDAQYSTFATFGDPTGINAPGIPTNGKGVDPRFYSPAPPIGAFGGVRYKF